MRSYLLDVAAEAPTPTVGEAVLLDREESRHLLTVMRARPGARVRLLDGRARVCEAVLEGREGGAARLRIESVRTDASELAAPRLVLACAVIKGKRFETLLEQAAELGAHRIVPLIAARGEVTPGGPRRGRWRSLLRGALKQSGRSWLPELSEPAAPAELADILPGAAIFHGEEQARYRAWNDCRGGVLGPADLLAAAAGRDAAVFPGGDLVWCVGPEGGWDERESELLGGLGRPVRLGPHCLRTATAALAGLALLASAREMLALDAGGVPGA